MFGIKGFRNIFEDKPFLINEKSKEKIKSIPGLEVALIQRMMEPLDNKHYELHYSVKLGNKKIFKDYLSLFELDLTPDLIFFSICMVIDHINILKRR